MTEILMLGEIHDDENRDRKIINTLKNFGPDRVLLEGTEDLHKLQRYMAERIRVFGAEKGYDQDVLEALLWDQRLRSMTFNAVSAYSDEFGITYGFLGDNKPKFEDEDAVDREVVEVFRKVDAHGTFNSSFLHQVQAQTRAGVRVMMEVLKAVIDTEEESSLPLYRQVGVRDAIMMRTLKNELRNGDFDRVATVNGMAHIAITPRRNSFYSLALEQGLSVRREFLFD